MRRRRTKFAARRPVAAVAAAAALSLLAACSDPSPDQPPAGSSSTMAAPATAAPTSATGSGSAQLGRMRAELNGSTADVTVRVAELTPDQKKELRLGGPLGIAAGAPTDVTVDGPLPAKGVTLTRRYDKPLPPHAAATFAFYDEDLGAWRAVPSTLSADRRTLSATVHHLSSWTDFVGGTVQAMKKAAHAATSTVADAESATSGWLYYNVGKTFGTRVDPPSCTTKRPSWVRDVTFIETDRNNPLLFCAGRDTKHPDLLVLKARVNRAFGWTAQVRPKAAWKYNSTFHHDDYADALNMATEMDAEWGRAVAQITANGDLVAAGEELSIGLGEDAVRAAGYDDPALVLHPPSVVSFLAQTLARIGAIGVQDMATGVVAATLMLFKCARDLNNADGPAHVVKAAASCLPMFDSALAGKLGTYIFKRSAARAAKTGKTALSAAGAGKIAGGAVGRASIYLALIGPVFSGMNYFAATRTAIGARSVNVFPQPETGVPDVAVGGWAHHGVALTLDKDGTGSYSQHGCNWVDDIPGAGCGVGGDLKATREGDGLRLTVTRTFYYDMDGNVHSPVPQSAWQHYDPPAWGQVGDYATFTPGDTDGVWILNGYYADGTPTKWLLPRMQMCKIDGPEFGNGSICGA